MLPYHDSVAGILSRVKADELTQVEAAEMLGLSYRQTKRLYRRFFERGADGAYHHTATARQKQEGIVPIPQFGRMCAKLGIDRSKFAASQGPGGTGAWDASRPANQEDAFAKGCDV